MISTRFFLPLCCLSALSSAQAIDFKKEIAPILEKNCYECHSDKAGKKKAGFKFDDLEYFGKDISPKGIIVPGSPTDSHFYTVIADRSHKNTMPPDDPLSEEDLKKLRQWIEEGAAFTEGGAKGVVRKKDLPPIMSWTNSEGRKIKAGFVRLEGDNVILRIPQNAQEVAYPLSKLSPESRKLALECGAP